MDAQAWIKALKGFATGGLQGAGVPLPGPLQSNPIQQALQNPDNQAALGIARIPLSAEKIIAMRAQGMGPKEIANQLGVHRNTIQNRVNELGLDKPGPVFQRPGRGAMPAEPTPAAQPSMPQLKATATPAPAEDPEMAKAMTDYLRSTGVIQ